MPPIQYAEVAVNIPVRRETAGRRGEDRQGMTFHYHIPAGLDVQVGSLVWVSFGAQHVQGIVVGIGDTAPVLETKPILALCDPAPYLTAPHQLLVRWMADYYLCTLSDAAFLLLPPGIQQRSVTAVAVVPNPSTVALANLSPDQRQVWELLSGHRQMTVDEIRRTSKLSHTRALVDQLLRRGLIAKHQEVAAAKVRPKLVRTAWLVADEAQVQAELDRLNEPPLKRARALRVLLDSGEPMARAELYRLASTTPQAIAYLAKRGLVHAEPRGPVSLAADPRTLQTAIAEFETPAASGASGLLAFLAEHREPIDVTELTKVTGTTAAQVNRLAAQGIVHIEEREVRRDPLALRTYAKSLAPALTADQEAVFRSICEELAHLGNSDGQRARPILLHGVTGSGKTEIYLRALQETLAKGRQAIIMVPEIALTPQTIQRFASRFPGRVAVLHSRLSLGEHFDEWRRIRDGLVDIVIGSRSAVFAPLPRLGLIVMDEEHEWTYKQTDTPPRYHARDVALKLAEITGALVILGSATPDVVTFQRARDGELKLLEMLDRVVPTDRLPEPAPSPHWGERGGEGATSQLEKVSVVESPLPPVEVVDLRLELKAGNRSIFSRSLHSAMTVALAAGQQVILFLNRRGTATFIMCRDCGHVLRCRNCDTPLGYHRAEDDLVCHQCNRHYLVPQVCPQCWSKRIKFFGIGTQKVEEEVHNLFPSARTLRWDRDATTTRFSHELILDRFVRHEADVLIGTQMIAKGLDLPLVTLVGVVSADTALHLPDFRAGERTFQILTQVAGRAGRSALGGKVIVQTYTPEHYAIQAASHHDYQTFAAQEITFRARKGYPPFSQLARLVYYHPNKSKAQAEAERMHQSLVLRISQEGLPELKLLGPAPCFVSRLRGRYRWQIIVQAPDVHPLLAGVSFPAGWAVDVDPVSLL